MNIDLHSHFFPVEALQNPGKFENRAPKLVLNDGKLSVKSQIGFRPGLGAGAYDPLARIKALDQMKIDMQAISPSPILLFYWEDAAVAAHSAGCAEYFGCLRYGTLTPAQARTCRGHPQFAEPKSAAAVAPQSMEQASRTAVASRR